MATDWMKEPEIQALCNETIYDHGKWLNRVMDAAALQSEQGENTNNENQDG